MDTKCYIEIPADKLRDAVRLAYDYSQPQGMGFFHAKEGSLTEDEIDAIIADPKRISMDYVHGRACKFHVYENEGKFYVGPSWYDHGDYQLEHLLGELGIDDPLGKMTAAREAQELANAEYRKKHA